MPEKTQYTYEELTSPDWLSSRRFDVFERVDEYQVAINRRLRRATSALQTAGIPYAVVGGNAVAAWVASVDESAVRKSPNIDIIVGETDSETVSSLFQNIDFIRKSTSNGMLFVDGEKGKVREGVHVIFAGQKVRQNYDYCAPEIKERKLLDVGYYVVTLHALVEMKLTSNRTIDLVHLQDMLSVGLIDNSWMTKLPPDLAKRFQYLLDNPED